MEIYMHFYDAYSYHIEWLVFPMIQNDHKLAMADAKKGQP